MTNSGGRESLNDLDKEGLLEASIWFARTIPFQSGEAVSHLLPITLVKLQPPFYQRLLDLCLYAFLQA